MYDEIMKENIFLCKYFMKFYETKNLYIHDITKFYDSEFRDPNILRT